MKTAVLFPGIGYHCDKPLLYYAGKLARAAGYEVLSVPYTGFPKNIRNDREKIREAIALAVEQTEQILMGQKWPEQADILFISKSIGTVAASQYAMDKGLSVRSILFTPLPEAFEKAVLPAELRHAAVAFSHVGKALFEVFRFMGVKDIAYNQPASLPYPTENPFK